MKEVLVITSKNPNVDKDLDGGSILIKQFVKHLPKYATNVDVIYLRSQNEQIKHDIGIRKIMVHEPIAGHENKFQQRLCNIDNTMNIVKKHHNNYQLIIVTHVSNCFGIEELSEDIRNKIVLFPMFTSSSYSKSGEFVPGEYIYREKLALGACERILTPSELEKNQMVNEFGVNADKICVVPRGIDECVFYGNVKSIDKELVNIIYIAAVRKQKNHTDLIEVCKTLIGNRINFKFHLVGGGENEVLEAFIETIEIENLQDYFVFHGVMESSELSKLMDDCHINISVAMFETFGRGIYEGLMKGLPTVAYNRIECLWGNLKNGEGIIGVNNTPDLLSEEILKLVRDSAYYDMMSRAALSYTDDFSEEKRMLEVLNALGCTEEGRGA